MRCANLQWGKIPHGGTQRTEPRMEHDLTELARMAKDYQRRAARLRGDKEQVERRRGRSALTEARKRRHHTTIQRAS